jgi:YceI-like protein
MGLLLSLVLMASTGSGGAAGTGGKLSVVMGADASLELEGDSSLHRYHAKASGMRLAVGLDDARVAAAAPLDLPWLVRGHFIKTLQLAVPVDGLSSGDRGLDDNLRKTLRSKEHREISFTMDSYDALAATQPRSALTVVLRGRLSVAGVERRIEVGATGLWAGDGWRFSGSKSLLMTDYGVKPPTALLGTIKAANLVTIKFAVTLRTVARR